MKELNNLINKMDWLGNIIEKYLKCFLLLIFSIMVIIVILQIFRRSVLGSSFPWVEELARYLFIWNIFVASAIGVKEKNHAAVEFIVKKIKSKRSRLIVIILKDLFIIFFALTITIVGVKRTGSSIGSLATTLPISRGWIYSAIPVGGFLMAYYGFIELFRSLNTFMIDINKEIS